MKKETLYEIYDCMDDVMLITNNLMGLSKLSNKAGEIFLSFCKNGLINRKSMRRFVDLSRDIEYSCLGMETYDVVNSINEVMVDDYVKNDVDYKYLIDNYSVLLMFEIENSFIIESEDEFSYYRAFLVTEFNRLFKNMKDYPMENLYTHDLCEIIDAYNHILEDLPNTTTNDLNMDNNSMLMKRIQYFIDIISDKAIYELDDVRFSTMLEVASTTTNIEDLKLLKNNIKLNRILDIAKFADAIDNESSDVNAVTVGLIHGSLGAREVDVKSVGKKILLRSFVDSEKEREIIKKVLKPEDNA